MSEASCRNLATLFQMGAAKGISREAILDGSGLDLESAARQSNWIPYSQLAFITARTAELIGGLDVARELSSEVAFRADGMRAVFRLVQAFTGPKNLYLASARWISRQLFTMIVYTYTDLGDRQCALTLQFEEGYEPTEAIVALFAGTFEGLPRALGYPAAKLDVDWQGRTVRFFITTPSSRSVVAHIKRLAYAPFAGWGLVQELEHQSLQLEMRLTEIGQAQEEVRLASELRATFLATISNELRAPLDVITQRTSQLLVSDIGEPARELVHAQHQSAARLRGLVDKMMDFIQVSTDDYKPAVEPFDVEEFLEEIEEDADMLTSKAGHSLVVFSMSSGAVLGDAHRLKLVLLSLVENAVRHGCGSRVWLDASLREERWVFEVRDNGVGMDDEQAARLFEPLMQGEASLRRVDNSIGLSAAIARRVIEAMDGRIRCDSVHGRGTTVTVELPAANLATV